MTLLNYAIDNGLLFWAGFTIQAGITGYSFISAYFGCSYVDKGVQTDAWEDYSNRPSQIGSDSVTSLDTITPISENISPIISVPSTSEIGTQTITDSISTVTTILPVPTTNIEIIPNPDIGIRNLNILINPVELSPADIRQMEILNSAVDLTIIEAYIPIPEIIDTANTITQFYPWF
jgi:hypothetical protein